MKRGWPIGIADPLDQTESLTSLTLRDEAFSVSAPHGKAFQVGDEVWGHVIDPRRGYPVQGSLLSAVVCSSATACDAVSTALLAMEQSEVDHVVQKFPNMRILCAYRSGDKIELFSRGLNS